MHDSEGVTTNNINCACRHESNGFMCTYVLNCCHVTLTHVHHILVRSILEAKKYEKN